jgi:hypothetical protein
MVPHRPLIFVAALMVSAGTAHAQIKPRTIEPGRIIAAGEFPAPVPTVKPRTIEPGRIIAAGEFPAVTVKPRIIALTGIVAQGSNVPVSPRTIRLTGWTASTPRGGRK